MAVIESYLMTSKNLNAIIDAIVNAQAPEKFTNAFMQQLGFKSTNDRLYIRLFKDLGLLESGGQPAQKYYEFIDKTRTKEVLGDCIKIAYEDLFRLNKNAQDMTKTEVKNKLKTFFQGSKKENVLDLMAKTFKDLCSVAEFIDSSTIESTAELVAAEQEEEEYSNRHQLGEIVNKKITTEMHYNIQIHLPETKDIAVYDAIFKSLKEHLL